MGKVPFIIIFSFLSIPSLHVPFDPTRNPLHLAHCIGIKLFVMFYIHFPSERKSKTHI
jgi:hypothetical protein